LIKGSIKSNVDKCFENSIPLKSAQSEMTKIDEESNGKEKNDNCMFSCFQKKKTKLQHTYNFSSQLNDLINNLESFKKGWKKVLSEEILKEDFNCIRKDSIEGLVNIVTQNNKVTVRLKDEVDKFAEYFNIGKMIEKQENKLKVQKMKLEDLEEHQIQNECIICMENERKVLFFPCLHLICCEHCGYSKLGNDCPTCHKKIEKREYILS
jgi:hypothetical protein